MANIRAQVVIPYLSGLPEDVAVNTFHFIGDGPTQYDDVAAALVQFYNTVPPAPATGAVAAFLSNALSRVALACQIKLYALEAPTPRVPTIVPWTLGASASSAAKELPAEVALCTSIHGTPKTPRTRGRLYIGPFSDIVLQDVAADQRSTPSQALRDSLRGASLRLAGPASPRWAIWSPTDGAMVPVDGGWVDDAWDTQRRRGQEAESRLVWSRAV